MAMAAGEPPPGAPQPYINPPRAPRYPPFASHRVPTPSRALASCAAAVTVRRRAIAVARRRPPSVKLLNSSLSLPLCICELIRASI
jgi:hypothetical protein